MTNTFAATFTSRSPTREAAYEFAGKVSAVFRGCGMATIDSKGIDGASVTRDTKGIRFNELRIGQKVVCSVAASNNRVLHAHQQTQPMGLELGRVNRPFTELSKEEFVAEYCRQRLVKWADIERYRVAVPRGDGVGWRMKRVGVSQDGPTAHGPL